MKRFIIALIAIFMVCESVFGGSANLQLEIGSSQIQVNSKTVTLPQPVVQNETGVMVPLELLTKGLGASVNRKGDSITVTMPETPDIEFVTDKDKGLAKLLSLFDDTKYNVYIWMYWLTNDDIINKILALANKNIQVFLILDYKENFGKRDILKLYNKKNVFIKFQRKYTKTGKIDKYYKYHKKCGVFDGKIIFTGSSNWTEYGFTSNDEQNFIIWSKEIALKAKKEFLEEWKNLKTK